MSPLLQDGTDFRKLVLRQAIHLFFIGPKLHLEQNTGVVDDRRYDGSGNNYRVFYAQCLRHNEGSGAHDGRHQLSTDRSGGNDRPGEFVRVVVFLHQGDGKGTSGDHYGHGSTVDHAQQAGGNDAYLSGATLGAAGNRAGQIIEQLPHTTLVHYLTKDDKHNDIGGGHLDG